MTVDSAPSADCIGSSPEVAPRRHNWVEAALSGILLLFIRVYQLMISPFFGPSCRFEPSCSRYAASCIRHLGPARGAWLTVRRLSRCHPFGAGGYDPPPTPSYSGEGRSR